MVEWKKLGEVASYYRGVTYNKKQEVPFNSGGTKILRANNITLETNSLNFEDVKEISSNVIIKDFQWLYPNDILICAGSGSKEHVGKVAYISSPLKYAYGGFMGKIIASEELKPRFLFHIFSSSIFKKYLDVALNSTTINNLNSTLVNDFQIPIPSLSEQERIVGILDTFTASIDNIKAQIEQRRKQYEHYRNTLLTFNKDDDSVEWKTLGEIGTMYKGKGIQKSDFVDNGKPCIHYGQVHTFYGFTATKTKSFVSEEMYSCCNKAKKGDLIIATTSEDVEACCKATVWLGDSEPAISGDAHFFRHNQNPKYIGYLFMTEMFASQKKVAAVGAKVTRVHGESIMKFKFPFPTLARQQEIVSILDTFEASITNLEAQLEQRQKQYEYYREKLLTFE